jgi:hypothetical protein
MPAEKVVHTGIEQTDRMNLMMSALSALCIEKRTRSGMIAHMIGAGFDPIHRRTKQPVKSAAKHPVIWRKSFNEGHGGAISVSDADGTCLGLYQNIGFDRQRGDETVAAGAEAIRTFAAAKGYTPLNRESAIKIYKADPPSAIGQYEGPNGKVTVMVAHSPGEQILDGNTLATRLGGVRFLVVAGAQHI